MDSGQLARRLAELIGWGVVAAVGSVMLTQAVGWDGTRLVATLQSLTPYGVPFLGVVVVVALWQRWHALGLTGAVVGFSVLALSIPLVWPPQQPDPLADASGVRVGAVNLLFSNTRVGSVADELRTRELDVIVFSEFTEEHYTTLTEHVLAEAYPHQINRNGLYAGGMAVWSKYPLSEQPRLASVNRTIDTTVAGPDAEIRLLAVHPPTPIFDLAGWKRELAQIGEAVDRIDAPLLVIGDFNASFWHPLFRDLLRRDLTDAHIADHAGWSTSWPTDEFVPPFVRLDHALVGNGLVTSDVRDYRVPGSDHAGFDVVVKPSEAAVR